MEQARLPENVGRLADGESFQFKCHPGVTCFNECCRALDLALTPYDVLRLRKALGLSSAEFFDQHAIIEQLTDDHVPQVYLAMVDDGRASCPFVTKAGCSVYPHRPGACRTYPLGRGAYQTRDGSQHDFHVLLTEPHCCGFTEDRSQTVKDWNLDQGLAEYNALNDTVMAIQQHQRFKSGMKLGPEQIEHYLLALYRLDDFRQLVAAPDFSSPIPLPDEEHQNMLADEEALLTYSIRWLAHELFGE